MDIKLKEKKVLLEKLLKDFTYNQKKTSLEIAIIGIAGRYPQSESIASFWENLVEGKDCITEIPNERWSLEGFYDEMKGKEGKSYSKWGGFLTGIDEFDALFFNISPREAKKIDPQERLFLEIAWRCIEDSGYTADTLVQSSEGGVPVGVIVGVMYGEYQLYAAEERIQGRVVSANSSYWSIANRVSYYFNFTGPSFAVDTACSSSLSALHLGCEILSSGQTKLMLVGGINLSMHPAKYISISREQFAASDGRCRSFGKGGDGYVPGEGVGALLLKPLKDAQADGDHIYGVIKGTAVNHGGKTAGYTVPNPKAQAEVVKLALTRAGVSGESISYVEAHGTGTSLGDPVEVRGLSEAYKRSEKNRGEYCALGSVKSNIGHLEAAAGIAAVTKVLLQMQHKQLVPSLHCEEENPHLDLEEVPFKIQKRLESWERGANPRRAGVSSFGAGGSNAHVILEEYEEEARTEEVSEEEEVLIVLSAKTEERLKVYVEQLHDYLKRHRKRLRLGDVAYTLQVGREAMESRLAIITHSFDELLHDLHAYRNAGGNIDNIFIGEALNNDDINNIYPESENLNKIAADWTIGIKINWDLLHSTKRKRLSLPTYPFNKIKYWVPNISKNREDQTSEIFSGSYLELVWKKFYLDSTIENFKKKEEHILVLVDKKNEFLYESIKIFHDNANATKVIIGEKYVANEENIIEINFSEPDDYAKLIKHYSSITSIYFLSGIHHTVLKTEAEIELSQEFGIYSLFRLIKALKFIKRKIDINIITNSVISITDSNPIYPYSSSLLGFARVFSKEYKNKIEMVRIIDVSTEHILENNISFVLDKLYKVNYKIYDIVCLRGENLYAPKVRTYESKVANQNILLKQGGVYLIVGGAGGVGFEFAKFLATQYQAKVALIGRSSIDAEKRQLIQEIEDLGGQAIYCRADVTNYETMENSINEIKVLWGKINGFIHSAAVLSDMLISQMQETILKQVLDPNITGSIVLSKLIMKESPDFLVFFSSAGSIFANVGQANYVSACAFKDAYAMYLKQYTGKPVILINWGYIENVGLSKKISLPKNLLQQGITPISKQSLPEIFKYIFQYQPTQITPINIVNSNENIMNYDKPDYPILPSQIKTKILKSFDNKNQDLKFYIGSIHEQIDRYSRLILLDFFQRKNIFKHYPERHKKQEIMALMQIDPKYKKQFDLLFYLLSKDSLLEITDDYVCTTEIIIGYKLKNKLANIVKIGDHLRKIYPTYKEYIDLLTSCFEQYQNILSGNIKVESIFNVGNVNFYKILYENNIQAEYFNQTLSASIKIVIEDMLNKKPLDQKIQILEIGAGSGGATSCIAPSIINLKHRIEYVFSDISQYFVNYGKKRFLNEFPFIKYVILDIESDNVLKEIKGQQFDIIIAYNVLHATKNIAHSLKNISKLLNPNGMLFLNETTYSHDFSSVIFGLIDSWWNFNDKEKRLPYSPLLSINQWKACLEDAGWHHTDQIGFLDGDLDTDFQNIILSLAPTKSHFVESINQQKTVEVPQSNNLIMQIIKESLDIVEENIQPHNSFNNLGIDSITSIEIVEKINDKMNINLLISDLYDYPTISRLSEYIDELNNKNFQSQVITLPQIPTINTQKKDNVEKNKDIAIIGISARLPGVNNLEEFWQNLLYKVSAITNLPESRLGLYRNDLLQRFPKAGYLDHIDKFDSKFFSILDIEANYMDPQQRILLEETWKAIENSGYKPKELSQLKCGIFVGARESEYFANLKNITPEAAKFIIASNTMSMTASRIANVLDLKGQSLAINTTCTSFLVAIHLACNSIINGENDIAFAGGVSLLLEQKTFDLLSKVGLLSSKELCQSFSEDSDGFALSESVGVIVLKPLDKAISDNDYIHGVIKSSGINQNGLTNGILAPSAMQQTNLVLDTYRKANIHPETLSLIEAHGTGNKMGDIIEFEALTKAFKEYTNKTGFCAIGSVKSNVGHALEASGVASTIKVLLSLKHKIIPPMFHDNNINSELKIEDSPFYINFEPVAWMTKDNMPRRAAINSYGINGTNCHILVEEAPKRGNLDKEKNYHLLCLSAKTETALINNVNQHCHFIKTFSKEFSLAEICTSLNRNREHYKYRLALVAKSKNEMAKMLGNIIFDQDYSHQISSVDSQIQHINIKTVIEKAVECKNKDSLEYKELLCSAAHLYMKGYDVLFDKLYITDKRVHIPLPMYMFDKITHWHHLEEAVYNKSDDYYLNEKIQKYLPSTIKFLNDISVDEFVEDINYVNNKQIKVAVIGAGPSGLTTAKALLEEGHQPIIFEEKKGIGGQWFVDSSNDTTHNYKNVRFQTSKYTSFFSDFNLDHELSLFPTIKEVNRYLHKYSEHFNLTKHIQFGSKVVEIKQNDNKEWEVYVQNEGNITKEVFDAVAVCVGGFWKPNIPNAEILNNFTGQILHSSEYIDAEDYRGKNVLVVGNGVSGLDISVDLVKSAKKVHLSFRNKHMILPRMTGYVPNDMQITPIQRIINQEMSNEQLKTHLKNIIPEHMKMLVETNLLPEDITREKIFMINDEIISKIFHNEVQIVPEISKFKGKKCFFVDKSSINIDSVIYCTGYNDIHEYQFFYDLLGEKAIPKLYENVFHPDLTNFALIGGIEANLSVWPTLELQGRWFSMVLSGKCKLPLKNTMFNKIKTDIHRGKNNLLVENSEVYNIRVATRIGSFPTIDKNWKLFWKLINLSTFPCIYRLIGPHKYLAAQSLLEDLSSKAYIDHSHENIQFIKYIILASIDTSIHEKLLAESVISKPEFQKIISIESQIKKLLSPKNNLPLRENLTEQVNNNIFLQSSEKPIQIINSIELPKVKDEMYISLKKAVSYISKIQENEIDIDVSLNNYRFDSITLSSYAVFLEKIFPFIKLAVITFIDYPTIRKLTDHLLEKHETDLFHFYYNKFHLEVKYE